MTTLVQRWMAWRKLNDDGLWSAIIGVYADNEDEARSCLTDELRRDRRNTTRQLLYRKWVEDGQVTSPDNVLTRPPKRLMRLRFIVIWA